MKARRVFNEVFKEMAVELSYAKGFVQEAACELGIDSGRITKWRQSRKSLSRTPPARPSEEQKQIKQLQKELKEAQIKRSTLWRRSASSPRETGNIRVYSRKRQLISG